jgi:hypothetical protein
MYSIDDSCIRALPHREATFWTKGTTKLDVVFRKIATQTYPPNYLELVK